MPHDQFREYTKTPNDPPAMPIATRQEIELFDLDESLLHELPIDEFLRDLPADAAVHDLSLDLVNASTSFQSQGAYGNLGYTGTLPLRPMNYMANLLPGQIPEYRMSYSQPTYHEQSLTPTPYSYPTALGPHFVTAESTSWRIHPAAFGSSFTTQEPTLTSIHPAQLGGTPKSHRTQAETIRCDWQGCTYKGTFGRRAFKCPKCGRGFNRRENLQGHLESVHMSSRRRR
ncbi:hypothetical protein N7494_011627 [Penicillium frequentans]|uniref:C2H2-type domain-containing protein n=1 Tax=Penicillium frequentans TaxID=3151616 RepID=A0AAD6GAB5_9EURO|nr:hypothetical protein N7494_011627 [Penicillium glabrum]